MKRIELARVAAGDRAGVAELCSVVEQLARSGRFILGEAVLAFEQKFATAAGARHAIGVASGSDALTLALLAAGVMPGDVVLTTPLSFIATAEAILRVGAVPRFIDVDDASLCLCPHALARCFSHCSRGVGGAMTSPSGRRVGAVVPVHLYGRIANMAALATVAREAGVGIVQDAAQAVGGRAGDRSLTSFGSASVSFFPTKNLGAWGDGGAVLTDDDDVAERVKMLRSHGMRGGRAIEVGLNSRLDALQAAVLDRKLAGLGEIEAKRREHAEFYRAALPAWVTRPPPLEPGDACHIFTVRCPRRDAMRAHLDAAGIGTGAYYPELLSDHPIVRSRMEGEPGDCPNARRATGEVLALPIHEHLTRDELERVVMAMGSSRFGDAR
ncbi:MAG: DegT/DnrJ/EryC1/StrS family aminotransferase [Myxococcales bacterium]|nr:DegT/DnrJ/EryC1/StrS family aminotransferase [Myxococcales bacterium]